MHNVREDIVESLYKKGFFRSVSPFLFLADFNEKMDVAFRLTRRYFQTDMLDDIVYDVVKSYCLSEDYRLNWNGNLEDTDEIFSSFFDRYIQPFVQMARYVEDSSRVGKK